MKSNVIYGSAAIKGRGRYTIDIMNNVDSMVFSDVREGSTCISISHLSLSCCQMTREFYVNGYEQGGEKREERVDREANSLFLFLGSHFFSVLLNRKLEERQISCRGTVLFPHVYHINAVAARGFERLVSGLI